MGALLGRLGGWLGAALVMLGTVACTIDDRLFSVGAPVADAPAETDPPDASPSVQFTLSTNQVITPSTVSVQFLVIPSQPLEPATIELSSVGALSIEPRTLLITPDDFAPKPVTVTPPMDEDGDFRMYFVETRSGSFTGPTLSVIEVEDDFVYFPEAPILACPDMPTQVQITVRGNPNSEVSIQLTSPVASNSFPVSFSSLDFLQPKTVILSGPQPDTMYPFGSTMMVNGSFGPYPNTRLEFRTRRATDPLCQIQ